MNELPPKASDWWRVYNAMTYKFDKNMTHKMFHNIPLEFDNYLNEKRMNKLDRGTTIFRGVSFADFASLRKWWENEFPIHNVDLVKDQNVRLQTKTITSWTTNIGTAESFAWSKLFGIVFSAEVDSNCIYAKLNTYEDEVIVKPCNIKCKIENIFSLKLSVNSTVEWRGIAVLKHVFNHFKTLQLRIQFLREHQLFQKYCERLQQNYKQILEVYKRYSENLEYNELENCYHILGHIIFYLFEGDLTDNDIKYWYSLGI